MLALPLLSRVRRAFTAPSVQLLLIAAMLVAARRRWLPLLPPAPMPTPFATFSPRAVADDFTQPAADLPVFAALIEFPPFR